MNLDFFHENGEYQKRRMLHFLIGLAVILACLGNLTYNGKGYLYSTEEIFQMNGTVSNLVDAEELVAPSSTYTISWPQVDDRIGQAIRNGVWIMPNRTFTYEKNKTFYMWNNSKYEAPTEKLATIVSCYYHVKGKHSWATYKNWMGNMLSATDPMIIFVDHTTFYANMVWVKEIENLRQHAPTIIARLPYANLTMNTQFDESFWKKQFTATTKGSTQTSRLYNEKAILMKEVARKNPFETEHIMWVDIGYFRNGYEVKGPIIRNNISANGVQPGKMLFYNVYGEPCPQEIAAGIFGGTKEAVLNFSEKYWISFWDMVTKGMKVPVEQRVMVTMCRSWPDLCYLTYSRVRGMYYWFELGYMWIRRADFNFSTVHQDVSLKAFNLSFDKRLARAQPCHDLLPVTIVNRTVVFPVGRVTGETLDDYIIKHGNNTIIKNNSSG